MGFKDGEKRVSSLLTMGGFEQKEFRLNSVTKIPQAGQKTGLVLVTMKTGELMDS